MTETALERDFSVVDAARRVHARLGKRRPVDVYENELMEELRMRGIGVREGKTTQILFGGRSAGVYLADIVLDGNVLIEIKRAQRLTDQEKERFGCFVREFRYQRGYLMNFAGDDLEVETFPPSS